MSLEPVTIIVRGKHDTGRTTIAGFIRQLLTEEAGFQHVRVLKDTEALPPEKKSRYWDRLRRNQERPINIIVELEAPDHFERTVVLASGAGIITLTINGDTAKLSEADRLFVQGLNRMLDGYAARRA